MFALTGEPWAPGCVCLWRWAGHVAAAALGSWQAELRGSSPPLSPCGQPVQAGVWGRASQPCAVGAQALGESETDILVGLFCLDDKGLIR